MDSQSKSGSCTDDTVVIGADERLYKHLSFEEAIDLCKDVQFYKTVDPLFYYDRDSVPVKFTPSAYDPESYIEGGHDRLNLWYKNGDSYYILIDIDKPEYEP